MGNQQNAVVCLLQDRKNLHLYWDLSPERLNTLEHFMTHVRPGLKFCLRLIGVNPENNDRWIEQEVFLEDFSALGNWYFRGVNPDLDYLVEFGGKGEDGSFVLFSRTPVINLQAPSWRYKATVSTDITQAKGDWLRFLENQGSSAVYNGVERSDQ